MTSKYGQQGKSIEKILITNPGIGYTQIPQVRIISSSGSGAIATAILGDKVLGPIGIITSGFGYINPPIVTISTASTTGDNAIIQSFINSSGSVTSAAYVNAGSGYTSGVSITFQNPVGVATGSYLYNEVVRGATSGTTAYVKDWNKPSRILKVSIIDGNFIPGETIVGMGTTANGSNASYKLFSVNKDDLYDPYAENIQIEEEADDIIDFTQSNPFGDF